VATAVALRDGREPVLGPRVERARPVARTAFDAAVDVVAVMDAHGPQVEPS
jgi:hypothetical protein